MNERWVEKPSDPRNMTGKVVGASEDGRQLAVRWSDNVLRIEQADELTDYEPAAETRAPLRISRETLDEIARVSREWPDGIHTCAELQETEPGRRPCTCGKCPTASR